MRAAQFRDADDVLDIVANLLAGVGIEDVHHPTVMQRQGAVPADFDHLARFGEVIPVRLLMDRQVLHSSGICGRVSRVNLQLTIVPPIPHDSA